MDSHTRPAASADAGAARFETFSNVVLADTWGEIDRQIIALEGQRDAARAEMTRRRLNSIEGARFIIVKAVSTFARFDAKAVRTEMGDAWYEARQKPGTRTTFSVIGKPDALMEPPGASLRHAAEALFKSPSC